MISGTNYREMEKLKTGIPGLDEITNGGMPKNRITLLTGSAGSAKTIIATQFLKEGLENEGEAGVFVTFEETPDDIKRNMASFGWDIDMWEEEGKWIFVNVSPDPVEESVEIGKYDLGALLARIEYAVRKVKAKRVSIDSIGTIFSQLTDRSIIRRELFKILWALKKMDVTSMITTERSEEYGGISKYGVEEFVVDNVIILRNVLEEKSRRRTVEILKYRGTTHKMGEFPFIVTPEKGVTIIPLSSIKMEGRSSDIRISSGNKMLDKMCGEGFYPDSIILVNGATGCGKTTLVTEFLKGGLENNERCLLFEYELNRRRSFRNATSLKMGHEKSEKEGEIKIISTYPETYGLENHLVNMKDMIDEFKPNRFAIDSLSALQRVSTNKIFREFIIDLTSYLKQKSIMGIYSLTTKAIAGSISADDDDINSISDAIILLNYVEIYGEMRQGITVLKMRGSMHDKAIREYTIDNKGMHIGEPFRNVTGILSGVPSYVSVDEMERFEEMFK